MTESLLPPPTAASDFKLDRSADLQSVLAAWHAATLRLERTHETLRAEVERLRGELETKNRELARKNRLADLGQMASHVAHEVRNNLVPVELYASLLRRRLSDDSESLQVLDKISGSIAALDATVHDLLHFTSDRAPQRATLLLHALIEEVCASVAPQASAQDVAIAFDVPLRLQISADREMLRRAMLNLLLNSLDELREGGTIAITACSTLDHTEIEVADDGPGFPETGLEQLFEPFFTTKSGGTGLGLAIVDRIAAAHGGKAVAANCPEGGAAVTLRIPQHTAEKQT